MTECCCGNNGDVRLIYSCSGAANTGYLADGVARSLMKNGTGRMTCLAALGAKLSGFIQSAESSGLNIVLDGCSVSCGRKIFEKAGLSCKQYVMTDFDVKKGETVITSGIIDDVTRKIAGSLNSCGC